MKMHASCSVFEISDPKEPSLPRKKFKHMDPDNRVFLRRFHAAAQDENIELQYRVHPYQHIRQVDPAQLENEIFDADYAVCMYPKISHVGPELAHLLYDRRRLFRHVFLVMREYTPDEKGFYRGISAISAGNVQRESGIYEPIPLKTEVEKDSYDAEQQHLMSFWHVTSIRNERSREIMQSILTFA